MMQSNMHNSTLKKITLMTLPNEISNETMEFAVAIMQLGIAHKWVLMPPPVTTKSSPMYIQQAQT